MYQVEYSRNAHRFIKKQKKNQRLFQKLKLIDKIFRQKPDQIQSSQLSGELNFINTNRFKLNKVNYRIAFSVNKKEKSVYIWHIGVRENFYKKLLQVIK